MRRVRGEFVSVRYGRERFRFTLRRDQRKLPALRIDRNVESCTWERDGAVRSGTLEFRRPQVADQAGMVARGDRVVCEVDLAGNGRWRRLWVMTVDTPTEQVASGTLTLQLKPELRSLESSRASFRYRGKTARQITLDVARRFRVPVGNLPRARHRIDRLVRRSISPVDLLTLAWRQERVATGRRFDVSVSRGVIDVNELREPDRMLVLDEAIIDATVQRTLAEMTSAVVVTSTRRVGGRSEKIRARVVDRDRQRRYGHVTRRVHKPGLKTVAEARKHGREVLARLQRPRSELTFTHPGLPFLDRGAVVRVRMDRADFNRVAFVQATRHMLTPNSYEMEVTATFDDPWRDQRRERARRKRQAAARRRRRPGASGQVERPRPAKARRRS